MRKDKATLNTVLPLFIFAIVYLGNFTDNNWIVSTALVALWIGYLVYNLHSKYQYRKGNVKYVRFPTGNDQYYKIASIVLGLFICVLSIACIVWTDDFKLHGAAGTLIGLLVMFNGVLDVPKGMMTIDGNKMKITGIDETIDIRQVKEIGIYSDRIVVTNIYDEHQMLRNLAIDTASARKIEKYVSKNKKESDLKTVISV